MAEGSFRASSGRRNGFPDTDVRPERDKVFGFNKPSDFPGHRVRDGSELRRSGPPPPAAQPRGGGHDVKGRDCVGWSAVDVRQAARAEPAPGPLPSHNCPPSRGPARGAAGMRPSDRIALRASRRGPRQFSAGLSAPKKRPAFGTFHQRKNAVGGGRPFGPWPILSSFHHRATSITPDVGIHRLPCDRTRRTEMDCRGSPGVSKVALPDASNVHHLRTTARYEALRVERMATSIVWPAKSGMDTR